MHQCATAGWLGGGGGQRSNAMLARPDVTQSAWYKRFSNAFCDMQGIFGTTEEVKLVRDTLK